MKKNKSDNALTHGLYARDVVLPWENKQAFEALYEEIREDLNPIGVLEEDAVREVAELHWRKKRLSTSYLLPYHKSEIAPELIQAAQSSLAVLAAYLAQTPNPALSFLSAATSQLSDYIKASRSTDSAADSTKTAQRQLTSTRNVVEQAYNPASMERYLKTEAMIDSRIAKIISRLVGLKEYKKLYAKKPQQAVSPQILPPAESPKLAPPDSASCDSAPTPIVTTTKNRNWGDKD